MADGVSTVDLGVGSACTLKVVKELVDRAPMSFKCTNFQVHDIVYHLQLQKRYKNSHRSQTRIEVLVTLGMNKLINVTTLVWSHPCK